MFIYCKYKILFLKNANKISGILKKVGAQVNEIPQFIEMTTCLYVHSWNNRFIVWWRLCLGMAL